VANVVVPVFSLRRFSFTALTASTSMDVVIVRNVPTAMFTEALLHVKVHARTMDGGAKIDVLAYEVSQTPDAPGVDFLRTSALLTVTVNASTSPPELAGRTAATGFGGGLAVIVRGTRGTTGSCQADLEAELVLKE
jgi:hypothetical protein